MSSLYPRSIASATARVPWTGSGGGGVAAATQGGDIVGFNTGERRIEQIPPRHDDDVQARGNLVAPEQFARPSLRQISFDCRTELPGRGHSEPGCDRAVRHDEDGHEPSVNPHARVVGALELRAPPHSLLSWQRLVSHPSSATVSRFRPLARRRLSTIRPFLVDIRTRNPWVFFRRRVLG